MTALHWTGIAIAAVLAAAALWVWLWREPRVRASDAQQPTSFAQHCDDALDVIAADKELMTDIVAAFEPDQARAEHINRTLRRVEHTVPWPHITAEEAADCTLCSPSSLARRIEEDR